MNEHINKMNSIDIKFDFIPKSNENIKIIEDIKIFGEIIQEEKDKISNLSNSLIIKKNDEYNKTLKNWINPNKYLKAELLYRFSRDGWRKNIKIS